MWKKKVYLHYWEENIYQVDVFFVLGVELIVPFDYLVEEAYEVFVVGEVDLVSHAGTEAVVY